MAHGLQVLVIPAPDVVVDLARFVTDCNWTTNALGGFGSASLALPGEPKKWLRDAPKLALLRVIQDQTVLFEGQIEDHEYAWDGQEMSTSVQCFGLARLLSEESVQRIWISRNLDYQPLTTPGTGGAVTLVLRFQDFAVATGQFDPTNLTRSGVRMTFGPGTTPPAGVGNGVFIKFPVGLVSQILFDMTTPAGVTAAVQESADGAAWTALQTQAANTVKTSYSKTVSATTAYLRFVFQNSGGAAIASNVVSDIENIRLLGSQTSEDATGGLYGGTVLRDVVGLIPGLTLGQIDSGSEFTIESIERASRAASLEVVQEVAGYYTKEWGVYEYGRFDWRTIDLSAAHWLTDVADLAALNLRSSVDETSSREFVLYTDAASGRDTEASATSTSRDNPYVVLGRNKDILTSPGFPMTTNTSAQLAAQLIAARGGNPFASGTCTLGYNAPVSSMEGGLKPAYLIRAGENIKLTGLPKSDPFDTGRDGETLFHVVSTSSSLNNYIELTLDSQSQAIDALLARLAAVTRTLTG